MPFNRSPPEPHSHKTQASGDACSTRDLYQSVSGRAFSPSSSAVRVLTGTLDDLICCMARLAYPHLNNPEVADCYLRLMLKAQSQCRTTVETIAELKNPRPVAFVKQANIAHGPQQVNNGMPSRTEEKEIEQNKLLEANNELLPNAGTSTVTGQANSRLETVGAIDRSTNTRR